MIINHILLASAFFFTVVKVHGQATSEIQPEISAPQSAVVRAEPAKAMKGTYQFFILGEDSTQLKRTDLAEKIESYRDEKTVVHLKISNSTTIRILPRNEINSPSFRPITNEVVFQHDYNTHSAKR